MERGRDRWNSSWGWEGRGSENLKGAFIRGERRVVRRNPGQGKHCPAKGGGLKGEIRGSGLVTDSSIDLEKRYLPKSGCQFEGGGKFRKGEK